MFQTWRLGASEYREFILRLVLLKVIGLKTLLDSPYRRSQKVEFTLEVEFTKPTITTPLGN